MSLIPSFFRRRSAPQLLVAPVSIPYAEIWEQSKAAAPLVALLLIPTLATLHATDVSVPTFTADSGVAGESVYNNTGSATNAFTKFMLGPILLAIIAVLFLAGVIAWGAGQRAVGVTLISTCAIATIGRQILAWI